MTDYTSFDEKYAGPLEPDTVLPEQFFGSLKHKARLDGERRLMVAILEDALHCFRKHVRSTDPKARQLFLEAEKWITGSDQSWFFSFVNVCETLDIDPGYVRQGLIKWKAVELRRSALPVHLHGGGERDAGVARSERTAGANYVGAEGGDEEMEQPLLREASGA